MTVNLALIGCGAITQSFYLPAIAKHRDEVGRLWLVDPSDAARSGAALSVAARQARRLADIDEELNRVIVATPNPLHFPVASEALSRNADVLLEKPFVIWPEEGRSLIERANSKGKLIAINQTRRLLPLAKALRRHVVNGDFGALQTVVHREGTKLVWPFASGAGFSRGVERTGVIMDFGVHVIDFYHYVFQPEWRFASAVHDGFAGPEGLAEIELFANDAPVSIRLSRYQKQENVAQLMFERALVSFDVYSPGAYTIRWKAGKANRPSTRDGGPQRYSVAEDLLLNFLAASEKREEPVCDARSSLPVIELLDEIYRRGRLYPAELGSV
jgi:predicted dehydrogenase